MKTRKSLMTALIGIAMLAAPVAASARDHGREARRDFRAGAVHSSNAPRNFAFRNPAPVRRVVSAPRGFAPQRSFYTPVSPAYAYQPSGFVPAAVVPVGHGHHYGWRNKFNRSGNGVVCDEDGDDCRPAYTTQYSAVNPYPAAPYYGVPTGGLAANGACARAQVIENQIVRDRRTGHPAAAADLARHVSRMRALGCPVSGPIGGGLFGGRGLLGGGGYSGLNAYNNYGYNAAPAYGYGAPAYGYNQGYSGGMLGQLAPMLQQYIH